MAFHTKRSPSQAKRFLNCNGALALVATLPPEQQNTAGAAAEIGTCVHALIERCLAEWSEPASYEGRIIELIEDEDTGEECTSILRKGAKVPPRNRKFYVVDSDMIEGATAMTDYVKARIEELEVGREVVHTESRTNPLPDRDDTSGTADVTIDAWPDLLEVDDYKNGYNVVDEKDNEQLLGYLTGKAIDTGWHHESYRIVVVQPNAPHENGRVRPFDATKEDLHAYQKRLAAGIKKCETAEAALEDYLPDAREDAIAGEWGNRYLKSGEHCMFCAAKPICPAFKREAQSLAKIDFADELPSTPVNLELQKRQVANILKWAPRLEELIAAANVYALRAMEAGHKIEGFKLVMGRSNRRFISNDEKAIAAALVKKGYVKDAAKLYVRKMLTCAQIEGIIPSKLKKKYNAEFLEKPDGKLSVAPDDDPRAKITKRAADDFQEYIESDSDDLDFG